jgi:hypothetical protein
MDSGHISATVAYVMWREEHLCNASVLQMAHLFSLVIKKRRLQLSLLGMGERISFVIIWWDMMQ